MTDHAITTLNAALVEQVLQGTLKSEEYLKRVSADPASALVEIGHQMNFSQFEGFNAIFRDREFGVGSLLDRIGNKEFAKAEDLEAAMSDAGCALFRIGSYTIAAIIIGVGVVGILVLGPTTPVVIAFAAYFGCTAAVAFAAITGIAASIEFGVGAVATSICEWSGACAK